MLWFLLFLGIMCWFLFFITLILSTLSPSRPAEDIQKRPILEGKDLEEWTNIYTAISIQYQRSLMTSSDLADITWERWSELTGKEQWEKKHADNS